MATYKKTDFFASDAGVEARQVLKAISENPAYNTGSSYTANTTMYPTNQKTFVDKHMDYLRDHPSTDPNSYIANIRLMTKVRT